MKHITAPDDPSGHDYQRLIILEAVARSTRTSLEAVPLCKATLAVLCQFLPLKIISLHEIDAQRHMLQLLHYQSACENELLQLQMQQIPLASNRLEAKAVTQQTPLLSEDLAAPTDSWEDEDETQWKHRAEQCSVCIPLWFNNSCEGTLTASIATSLEEADFAIAVLQESGTILAHALHHARLYASLERRQNRLYAIADQLPEGVLVAESTGGTITYANEIAAQILGYPRQQLIGMPFHTTSRPSRKSFQGHVIRPWNYALTRAFCGEIIKAQETLITRVDGETRFLLCSSAPLREAGNAVVESIVVFQDISSQIELDLQRNTFVALASHEMRTPATIIQGFADLLLAQVRQGKPLSEAENIFALEAVVQHTDLLVRLLEEMLDLTHLDQAVLTLKQKKVDLIALISAVVEFPFALSKQHQVQFIIEGKRRTDQLIGWFDEERLRQILHNLLSNASKYSMDGSTIEVGLRWDKTQPENVLLWVRDEGIGISAKDLALIFQRFYRAQTTDRSLSGLGLGLYLAKELVTRLGGKIWAESCEGQGSTFFLSLPLQKSQASETNLQRTPQQ